jgi:hypothetical protein
MYHGNELREITTCIFLHVHAHAHVTCRVHVHAHVGRSKNRRSVTPGPWLGPGPCSLSNEQTSPQSGKGPEHLADSGPQEALRSPHSTCNQSMALAIPRLHGALGSLMHMDMESRRTLYRASNRILHRCKQLVAMVNLYLSHVNGIILKLTQNTTFHTPIPSNSLIERTTLTPPFSGVIHARVAVGIRARSHCIQSASAQRAPGCSQPSRSARPREQYPPYVSAVLRVRRFARN